MSTPSGDRVRAARDRLLPLYDVGLHALWPALQPRRGRKREDDAPAGGTRGLRGLRGGLDLNRRPWPDDLGFPRPGRPQEAVAQEIQVRAAKHLPFQHFQTVDVALDRPSTPRQRDSGFDGLIVLRQALRKAAQRLQRTAGRTLQPGIKLGRLPLAYQCGEVLREVDGLGDLGLLRLELGELLGLRLGALGRTAEHEPRRPAWCQGLRRGLGHHGQRLAPALAAWRQPLSLAEATDIGGHTAIAARVALGLELPKQLDGRPTPDR